MRVTKKEFDHYKEKKKAYFLFISYYVILLAPTVTDKKMLV